MLILILFFINTAHAQDFASIFSAKLPTATLGIEAQAGDPARNAEVTGSYRLYQNDKHGLGFNFKAKQLSFKEVDPRLKNYKDIEAGLSYRQGLEDDRFWSLALSYGSSSDEPFESSDVSVISATALMKFNSKWYGALNYSNNRTFAKGIPLPGFFYVHTMTREKTLIFGLPFAFIKLPMSDDFSFSYFAFIPWRHAVKFTYEREGSKPYFFLAQTPESFIPFERITDDERFYWVRREIGIGLEGRFKFIKWDLASGLSFAQEFYKAEDFNDDQKRERITPKNAGFVRIGLKMTFGGRSF